ncbi:flavoprotein [Scheffersomyces amazonensis]|uniref:flavoprotein n=1 Tax=Scheffersomyces amazonensis TaxID=1078765 RepID=UPI00315D3CFE
MAIDKEPTTSLEDPDEGKTCSEQGLNAKEIVLPKVERCWSPPPILTNGPSALKTIPSPTSNVSSPVNNQPGRETIKAGGALLKEKEKERLEKSSGSPDLLTTNNINAISPLNSPYIGNIISDHNESVTSLDYTLNPPKTSSHHKAPSVHAHFYVDEAVKPGKVLSRSRSGSVIGSSTDIAGSTSQTSNENTNVENQSNVIPTSSNSGTSSSNPNIGTGEQNANIDPRLPQDDGKIHILLGVCGALSTGKIKLIIAKLLEIYTPQKISIQLILTKSSENFISQELINTLENVKKVRIWRDSDEWTTWKARSDPVLHIELRRWADILIVCPLTANTLSKISLGICDNLLTNVIRAWNTSYPILLAPAMISYSYNAVTTKRQLRLIAEEMPWIEVLKPVEKVVGSYGDIGMGGMMDWNEIVNKIVTKTGGYPEEEEDEEDEDNDEKNDDEAVEDDDDEDDDDDDEDDDDEEEEEEEEEQDENVVAEDADNIESSKSNGEGAKVAATNVD